MPEIKIVYFDIRARAEAARLALYLGDVAFTDERVSRDQFGALKQGGTLPMGQLPIMTVDGKVLSQSQAILRYCGRLSNLYPSDAWEAAKVDEIMGMADDIMAPIGATMRMQDDEEKKSAREEILKSKWPSMLAAVERFLEQNGTGYYVGSTLTIADLQLYVLLTWVNSGVIDHVPTTVLDAYPLITANIQRVADHPKVAEWNEAHKK